jgi:hypothetical protein
VVEVDVQEERAPTWLGFSGSGTVKKKNNSDGYDDVINIRRYI